MAVPRFREAEAVLLLVYTGKENARRKVTCAGQFVFRAASLY
jgi:hypothetical protein